MTDIDDQIKEIRALANITTWEPGVPIRMLSVKGTGWMVCCPIVPGDRFVCHMCKEEQPIHHGTCDKCGAEIVIQINRYAWYDILRERERHIFQQERARTNPT